MGDKPTCGDCRWCEPDVDGDPPGRCGGGGVAIRVWPDNGACKAVIALMEAERGLAECEYAAAENVEDQTRCEALLESTTRERDEARGRASNLEREVAKYKRMVMGRIEAINELNAECKRLRTLLEGNK